MNYDALRAYGELIKVLAKLFLHSPNFFDGATAMYEFSEKHYLLSRLACDEVFGMNRYPSNQTAFAHMFDKHVLSDEVRQAFLKKRFKDDKVEIAFLDKNKGAEYGMLCHVQVLLRAMEIAAHPENFKEEQVKEALDAYIMPAIAKTEANVMYFNYALTKVNEKEAEAMKQEESVNQSEPMESEGSSVQPKSNEKDEQDQEIDKPISETHDNTKTPVCEKVASTAKTKNTYTISDHEKLYAIYKYLVDTNVISSDLIYDEYMNMIKDADASKIAPNGLWKFITSLDFVAQCIKGDCKMWKREICHSIGREPKDIKRNKNSDVNWYADLKDFIENSSKDHYYHKRS